MISIKDFTDALCAISEQDFTDQRIVDFLRLNPVDIESLSPYLYFSHERYTRNLICRTPLFELLAICWESGQYSTIHNHHNQKCWMTVAYGVIEIQDFKLVHKDANNSSCHLEPTKHSIIDTTHPSKIDTEESIHRMSNLSSFGSRTVTLHIYSRPFDRCEVYNVKDGSYKLVNLINTSEFSILKLGIPTQKISLSAT